jgi:2-methylcitrate dehydratase PrpD
MSAAADQGLSSRLARHVATATFEDLSDAAVRAATRSLLDALGVTLAASTLGEGCRPFVELVLADGGAPLSTVIGFGRRVPPAAAALANGAMAHALDFEDAHDTALVHPNAQTIPAVLALAETRPTTGRELITAIALGADLVCRLGLALGDEPARHGWYPPALVQAFGAAAGAARILHLDERATLDALSLTLTQVTGTAEMTRDPRSVIRGVRDAFGAQAGVHAARLAARGLAGFDRPFEGDAGLFALYTRARPDPGALVDDLGRRYEGANVSYKPWPSCRGTHGAIDAALRLHDRNIDPTAITDVVVTGPELNRMLCEPRDQRMAPRTAIDAKFSLPYTVARALVHGGVDLDAFTPAALTDPVVLSLAQRVRYEIDASPAALPTATRCRLTVTAAGVSHEIAVDTAPGGADRPVSDEALQAKFLTNAAHAAHALPVGTPERLAEVVWSLPEREDVTRDLLELLAVREPSTP